MAGSDSLQNKQISATYKDLLQVPNGNSGVDGTTRKVMDGEGTESALEVSTSAVKSSGTLESTGNTSVGGTLSIGGDDITASPTEINLLDGMTAVDADLTAVSANDDTLPTAKAVKSYVDSQVQSKDHLSELGGDLDDITEGTTNKHLTATLKTKLDGIEDSADVTDTANVTAAGALMDSELTDLTGVKGVTISTLQEKPSEGAFVDGDKTKLDGIATSATANDTDANLKDRANHTGTQAASTISDFDTEVANNSAVTANTAKVSNVTTNLSASADGTSLTVASSDGTDASIPAATTSAWGAMTDEDKSKLDGIESGAEVNVQSDWNASSGDAQILNKPTVPSALNDLSNVNASPTDGQVLKWVNASSEWQAGDDAGSGGSGGITNVSEDTTPQLGGDLDVNGNSIVSASNGDIVLEPNGTGKVGIGRTPTSNMLEVAGGASLINSSGTTQLTFAGSGAAEINQYVNNSLTLKTNNVNAIVIDDSQRVGIGATPSSSYKLLVEGDICASGGNLHVTGSSSTASGQSIYAPASNTMGFSTNSVERMRIDSSGDLTIKGGRLYVQESDLGNTAVAITRDADEGYVQLFSGGTQTAELRGNGNSYFNGGNLGIGTAIASQKLTVLDSAPTILNQSSNGDSRFYAYASGGDAFMRFTTTSGVSNDWAIGTDSSDGYFKISDNTTLGTNDRLVIDTTSGNVGVGSQSPSEKLHISGAGTQRLLIEETGSTVKTKLLSSTTAGVLATATDHPLGFDTNDQRRMTLTSTGLGIGETDPSSILHIKSSASTEPEVRIENANDDGSSAEIRLQKTTASPAVGDEIGQLGFLCSDTSGGVRFASNIRSVVEATGSNSVDGALTFSTYIANTEYERMRIAADGSVGIGESPDDVTVTGLNQLVVGTPGTGMNNGNTGIVIGSSSSQSGALTFLDNTDTSIPGRIEYDHANDALIFNVNSSERMRIESSGQSYFYGQLNVPGGGGTTTNRLNFNYNANNGVAEIAPDRNSGNTELKFSTCLSGTKSVAMRISPSGNVGIGGVPSGLLHLTASTDPIAILTSSTHGQNFHIGVDTSEGGGSPPLVIGTGTSVGSGTKLTLTPSGALTSTSTSDDAVFLKSSHANNANVYINNTNATTGNTANLYFGPANDVSGAKISAIATEDFSTSANRSADLALSTRNNGGWVEGMRITSAGRIIAKKASNAEVVNQSSGTCDLSEANNFEITMSGATTINLSLGEDTDTTGQSGVVKIISDGSAISFTSSQIKWAGGTVPTPSSTSGAVDILAYYVDGTDIYGQYLVGMA